MGDTTWFEWSMGGRSAGRRCGVASRAAPHLFQCHAEALGFTRGALGVQCNLGGLGLDGTRQHLTQHQRDRWPGEMSNLARVVTHPHAGAVWLPGP